MVVSCFGDLTMMSRESERVTVKCNLLRQCWRKGVIQIFYPFLMWKRNLVTADNLSQLDTMR